MKSTYLFHKNKFLVSLFLFFLSITCTNGQVIKTFTQRSSAANPSKLIYNIRGDYTMIGNTNLTLQNYDATTNNSNNVMKYVDVDTDPSTLNSSSATLSFSNENGAIPACSHIIYAGLYWTGRASNGSTSPETFAVTKNGTTVNFNKRKVKLKGPGQLGYTEFEANPGNIYYPNGINGNMYSAYVEVTNYVTQTGLGEYTLADLAMIEGDGGSTGFYGGWGMIVIYENSLMNWRDVTVFDGHAYVTGNSTLNYELPINGFTTVQNGNVKMKVGMMAGEGDVGISGDYFKIRNWQDNAWISLNHTNNSSTNFFNGSVNTGGNNRNPNLQNNTGLDIAMFDIPNTGNSVITNNQTSTRFQYGSNQDTYIIFCIAMAVDAYVPDVDAIVSAQYINGLPAGSGPYIVQPGQDIEYSVQITNLGTEAVSNTIITQPIPYTTTFVPGSITTEINFSPLPLPNSAYYDPTAGPNGSIIWDFGTLPIIPGFPDSVLATLTFHLQVTSDCNILSNPDCPPNVLLNSGSIEGIGAVSGSSFNMPFIQGYQSSGLCANEPISDPLLVNIDASSYLLSHCGSSLNSRDYVFCNYIGSTLPIDSIVSHFPLGIHFYNTNNVTPSSIEYTENNPFPAIVGTQTYFAIPEGLNFCYYTFTITVQGSITTTAIQNTSVTCLGGSDGSILLNVVGGSIPYQFLWTGPGSFNSSNQNISSLIAGNYTVTVTDHIGCVSLATEAVDTQIDGTNPILLCPGNQTGSTAPTSCIYTQIGDGWNASATDNCQMATLTAVLTGVTSASGLTTLNNVQFNKGITTVTWTAVDASGNSATCFYTVTVTDATAPVISSCGGSGIVSVNTNPGTCSYTVNGISWNPTATDNCSGVLTSNYVLSGATIGSGTGTLNNVSFNLGFTTVIWTVTDIAGNSSTCQFQVNVIDNQAPSITCVTGGPFTVPSNSGTCTYTQTSNAWNASASDLCAGTVSVSYTLSGASSGTGTTLNGQTFNSGTTQVMWTAIDAAGNTSTCSFNVTVTDNQNPIILTCGSSTTPTVNVNSGLCTYTKSGTGWDPTISDNCGTYTINYTLSGATTGTGTSLSGVQFNLGTTIVSWLAADGSGNTATCTFQVNVVDTQLPIFTDCGPVGNQQVDIDAGECNYTVLGTGWDANASDNCTVTNITYTMSGATTGTGSSLQNVNFNLGLTTVVWTAMDDSGNTSTCSFQVLVRDMQYPSISNCSALTSQVLPSNQGVCTYTNTSAAWNAIATDNCTVSQLTYTLSGATSGTGSSLLGVIFNPGTTNVLWTATDIAGNVVTCSFGVQVTDSQVPIITNCPDDILINSATGQCDTQVNWTAPGFMDNCGANMTVNIPSGSIFPIGTTTIVYTATDGSGNYSICSFTVTVTDNQVPIITCPPSVTSCDPIISYAFPTAIDNCGIQSVLQVSETLGSTGYPIGTTTDVYMATDIHGNTATCAVDVTVYEIPSMNVGVSQVSCYGLNDAVIDLIPFNGTPPYTYQWNNAWTQEDIFAIPAGTYSVEITDIHGCSRDTSITVSQPDPLALESSQEQVLCAAGSNGSIALSVAGGTDPYNFNWSNGSTESQVNELSAGTYSTVITDANGCVLEFETTLTEPDTLTLSASVEDAACNAPNGAILVEVSGGIEPYNYQWSDGSATVNLINVPHGIYSLEVTDLNGCSVYYMDTIQSLNNLNAYSIINNATCFGDTNGQINVFVRTGSGPFIFDWSDGSTGAINDSLTAGDYSVLITDLYGCQAIVTASITQPDSMTLHLGSPMFTGGYNVSSTGGNDGIIVATVNGGTSPYAFLWSNGETTPSIHDLNSGIYSVIVTDENGCPIYGTIRLSEPGILEMPNGFSPNGDSDNEFFVIHGLDAYPENHFVVYNRWGNIVYEKSNYENEWHGVNNTGEVLPDGTYFVILTVNKGGEEKALSGYVDMRRTH